MNKLSQVFLYIGVAAMLSAFSAHETKRVEYYDFIPSDNPNYQLLENEGQKLFCYKSVHVGRLHERRFVAGNEVFYFTREFYPLYSRLEIINGNDQVVMHGRFSTDESIFYIGRNTRYTITEEGTDILIHKDGQLIMNTVLIKDPVYGNRINLEYTSQDPNLKFLKLMALESTMNSYEKSKDRDQRKSDTQHKSRY